MSIESDIADKLVQTITDGVPELKSVSFDLIRSTLSDFRDHEIPAVQMYDVEQVPEHQRGRILVTWSISLELIMKSLNSVSVNQKSLWELRRKIQRALWAKPNLGIPGVVHLIYNGNITDLHLLQPYYVARLDFSVLFYDDLTGSC